VNEDMPETHRTIINNFTTKITFTAI